jgi:hypothetical protein
LPVNGKMLGSLGHGTSNPGRCYGQTDAVGRHLLRLAELLQEHITPALCHAAFGRVRRTERQRVWTLTALVQFWVAVILRAPKALSQALADGLEQREPLFPRVAATPEAFFRRCRDLRPAFFVEVSRRGPPPRS